MLFFLVFIKLKHYIEFVFFVKFIKVVIMKIINLKNAMKTLNYLIIILILIGVLVPVSLDAQTAKQKKKKSRVYPDEYSVLDEGNKKYSFEAEFQSILEESRQKYFQGLILIQKRDTVGAARYFEQALDKMNVLASYPGVDENIEFTELAQSILEDYELYIKNTDYLDPDSPLMIIKQIMYKEIESLKSPAVAGEIITPKSSTIVTPAKSYGNKIILPPDSISVPLTEHPDVNKNIEFYTERFGRKFLTRWLERSTRWFPMMLRIAESEGMPKEIIYLSMFESGLRPDAVSSAGAVGLWQFMRSTGELYQLNTKPSYWLDERRDPEKATRAAMRHLKDLYKEFGDWQIALAAYNRGAGGVARSMKKVKKEKPDYWDFRPHLPRETRQYVPNFIAIVKILQNLEAHNFKSDSLNFMPEYEYDIFELNEPVSLTALAKAAGISLQDFKDLNPELIKSTTPPDRIPYYIKIPKGSIIRFGGLFASLTPEEKQPFINHTVRRKENIASIAKMYKVPKDEIIVLNKLYNGNSKIEEEQTIKIPLTPDEFASLNINLNNIPEVADTKDNPISLSSSRSEKSIDVRNITHKVQPGENLFVIAKHYGIDVALIRKYNGFGYDDEKIYVGQELIIAKKPVDDISDEITETNGRTRKEKIITHKVKSGESLIKIAEKYKVSTANIKELNNLKKDKLKKGQNLKIRVIDNSIDTKPTNKSELANSAKKSIHKVAQGETLSDIATKYDITIEELKEWNKDEIKGNTVFANTRLKVSDDIKEPVSSKKSENTNSQTKKKSNKTYTVKSGDTLSSIAKKNGLTLNELKKKNRNIKENSLQIGQKLILK